MSSPIPLPRYHVSVQHQLQGAIITVQINTNETDGGTTWQCTVPYVSTVLCGLFDHNHATEIVWDRALKSVTEYILSHASHTIHNKRIVELGCGFGLPSLFMAQLTSTQCRPAKIIATDTHKGLLVDLVIAKNTCTFNHDVLSSLLITQELDWNDNDDNLPLPLKDGVDVIVACECISIDMYGKESIQALAVVIHRLVMASGGRKMTNLYLATDARRRGGDGLDEFLHLISPLTRTIETLITASPDTSDLYLIELVAI